MKMCESVCGRSLKSGLHRSVLTTWPEGSHPLISSPLRDKSSSGQPYLHPGSGPAEPAGPLRGQQLWGKTSAIASDLLPIKTKIRKLIISKPRKC